MEIKRKSLVRVSYAKNGGIIKFAARFHLSAIVRFELLLEFPFPLFMTSLSSSHWIPSLLFLVLKPLLPRLLSSRWQAIFATCISYFLFLYVLLRSRKKSNFRGKKVNVLHEFTCYYYYYYRCLGCCFLFRAVVVALVHTPPSTNFQHTYLKLHLRQQQTGNPQPQISSHCSTDIVAFEHIANPIPRTHTNIIRSYGLCKRAQFFLCRFIISHLLDFSLSTMNIELKILNRGR